MSVTHRPVHEIAPQAGPQTEFLACPADIVGYGGSAGGGKTFSLLLGPLYHIDKPGFGAVIFRRTLKQLRDQGGLWDKSMLYAQIGGRANSTLFRWGWESGASIQFAGLEHEIDVEDWQGSEICYLGIDEATHFTERQVWYLISRNRSTCGVKPYVRMTFNPDANSWVKVMFAPWVDSKFPYPAKSGEIRYLIREGDAYHWVPEGTPHCKSVTFIRASLEDNVILKTLDPGYESNLRAQSMVDRLRLLDGDWDIVEGGNMFRREWFTQNLLSELPTDIVWACRYWDLASSAPKPGTDPDWSAGVLVGKRSNGRYVILDVKAIRDTPMTVETLVKAVAKLDYAAYGDRLLIRMEQERGGAGAHVISHYQFNVLPGFNFGGILATGEKPERAKPLSAMCEAGNVDIMAEAWTEVFINEACAFPSPRVHDDRIDAAAGAYQAVAFVGGSAQTHTRVTFANALAEPNDEEEDIRGKQVKGLRSGVNGIRVGNWRQ